MKKTILITTLIIIASIVIGAIFYPQLPARMASHWNASGQADGYMSKFWGVFLMPLISIGMMILFWIIPKIDPLKKNIDKFKKYYHGFILLMIGFLFYLYLLTLIWNLGYQFNMTRMLAPALGILFYFIGIMLPHAKRNWFIGIRTPWTLSNDEVWDKTHKLAGRLFKFAGLIFFIGMLLGGGHTFGFVMILILACALYPVLYSYLIFRKR